MCAVGLIAVQSGCDDSSATTGALLPLRATEARQGLTGAQLDSLHHLGEGDEFIALAVLKSLNSTETKRPFLENIERFGLIHDPANADGLPIGLSALKPNDVGRLSNRMVGFTCAACHTAQLTVGGTTMIVEGGGSHIDAESFERELVASMDALKDPGEFAAFAKRLASRPQAERAMDSLDVRNLPADLEAMKRRMASFRAIKEMLARPNHTAAGFGRIDAFGTSRVLLYPDSPIDLTAPVRHPHIWNAYRFKWLHWDGNTNSVMERNIGQAIAAGGIFDATTGSTTLLPENLYALETLVGKIQPPKWPTALAGAIDAKRAKAGEASYAKHCRSCHAHPTEVSPRDTVIAYAEVGTDPMRATSAMKPLYNRGYALVAAELLKKAKDAAYASNHITPARAIEMENGRMPTEWRVTGGYVARPLAGIWTRAPYLHNGSVPSLENLLSPPAARPMTFTLGGHAFDAVKVGLTNAVPPGVMPFTYDTRVLGNSNTGHTYGTTLSPDQRRALLEYLKTL